VMSLKMTRPVSWMTFAPFPPTPMNTWPVVRRMPVRKSTVSVYEPFARTRFPVCFRVTQIFYGHRWSAQQAQNQAYLMLRRLAPQAQP
jgi:hypothetical protein